MPRGSNGGRRVGARTRPEAPDLRAHRRTSENPPAQIGPRGRIILHDQLQRVLAELISGQMKSELQAWRKDPGPVPTDLLVQHIASTFILVLNWWIERKDALAPKQVDELFRALVFPILSAN